MQIVVNDDAKVVELWFKNGENPDSAIPSDIAPMVADYREKKYLICLYQSGTGDLSKLTSQLLVHNHQQTARLQVTSLEKVTPQ